MGQRRDSGTSRRNSVPLSRLCPVVVPHLSHLFSLPDGTSRRALFFSLGFGQNRPFEVIFPALLTLWVEHRLIVGVADTIA